MKPNAHQLLLGFLKRNFSHQLLIALSLATATVVAAPNSGIYKSTDKHGNVVYSDQQTVDSDRVVLPEATTYSAKEAASKQSSFKTKPVLKQEKKAFKYSAIEFTAPSANSAIRSNNGQLTLKINIQPALLPTHQLTLMMDDKRQAATLEKAAFELTNIDRGSHSFKLLIENQDQQIIGSSSPLKITILRHSALNRRRQ